MNKTEFIQELRQELGGETTSREAEQVLDAVLNTIARSVQRKSQVKFRGFGTFGIKRAPGPRGPASGPWRQIVRA